jgi:hypothetical protein
MKERTEFSDKESASIAAAELRDCRARYISVLFSLLLLILLLELLCYYFNIPIFVRLLTALLIGLLSEPSYRKLIASRCPNCDNLFFRKGAWKDPFRTHCIHCGWHFGSRFDV